ncbi:MAG TPA: dihydropteroate synthase [Gammaproteobacteria bacterium]|nr:dihydropteroate synthase [Gammaproteobacteria bacterium]
MAVSSHGLLEAIGQPDRRPLVMGILNLTPDSFADGGRHRGLEAALAAAHRMVEEGADLLDLGGESTRPGARPVPPQQEVARVLPVLRALRRELSIPLSVDTSEPLLMREAVAAGAAMINDVRALRRPGALAAVADSEVAVCLMHMQGEPANMQAAPHYEDVTQAVGDFLEARLVACEAAGVARERVVLDPGFGFGKRTTHNLQLLAGLERLRRRLGRPLLVGLSRKRSLGELLDERPVEGRLHASVAAALVAAQRGARLVRVHDVGPTVDALRIWEAVRRTQESEG